MGCAGDRMGRPAGAAPGRAPAPSGASAVCPGAASASWADVSSARSPSATCASSSHSARTHECRCASSVRQPHSAVAQRQPGLTHSTASCCGKTRKETESQYGQRPRRGPGPRRCPGPWSSAAPSGARLTPYVLGEDRPRGDPVEQTDQSVQALQHGAARWTRQAQLLAHRLLQLDHPVGDVPDGVGDEESGSARRGRCAVRSGARRVAGRPAKWASSRGSSGNWRSRIPSQTAAGSGRWLMTAAPDDGWHVAGWAGCTSWPLRHSRPPLTPSNQLRRGSTDSMQERRTGRWRRRAGRAGRPRGRGRRRHGRTDRCRRRTCASRRCVGGPGGRHGTGEGLTSAGAGMGSLSGRRGGLRSPAGRLRAAGRLRSPSCCGAAINLSDIACELATTVSMVTSSSAR